MLSLLFLFFQALVVPGTDRPEVLSGNQLLILVGIVCTTILLLAVLILIVKKIHCSKRYGAVLIARGGRQGCRAASDPTWKRDTAPCPPVPAAV